LVLSPVIILVVVGFAFYATLSDLLRPHSFPAYATHVPTFYVPIHKHFKFFKFFHIFPLLTIGSIFGAIHCAGWNNPFPTSYEQNLWRVASLAVTIIPMVAFPIG